MPTLDTKCQPAPSRRDEQHFLAESGHSEKQASMAKKHSSAGVVVAALAGRGRHP